MVALIGIPFPVTADSVETNAEARAAIIRSIAGMTRYNYEMAVGKSAVAGEPACVPKNPQGLIGADRSGPPYGSAVRHILASYGGTNPVANLVGARVLKTIASGSSAVIPFTFYNRLHAASFAAPYSRGYVAIRIRTVSGTNNGLQVTARASPGTDVGGRVTTVNVSSTTPLTYTDPDLFFSLAPGMNTVEISIVNTGGNSVRVTECTINQIAKRSHT